jgi:hypothetical protein
MYKKVTQNTADTMLLMVANNCQHLVVQLEIDVYKAFCSLEIEL